MADLSHLDPVLKADFDAAVADWVREHPELPHPYADCVYRSPALQNATYAQGRVVADAHGTQKDKVNALRKLAGADPISAADSAQVVTHAKGGDSPHNYQPTPALDVKFIDAQGKVHWEESLFKRFAIYMLRNEKIEWGGHWPAGKRDMPHFQRKNWQALVHHA